MKKALVIVLALVMALSVVGLVSCSGKTYEGEYSYTNSRNASQKYGCKVKVTVQGDVITNVEVAEDTADFFNLSAGWTNTYAESGKDSAGKTSWLKYGKAMADSFVGLTTKEVLKMKVYVNSAVNPGEPITGNDSVETIKYMPDGLAAVVSGRGEIAKDAGATQSSARLILAVQDALLQAGGDPTKNPGYVAMDPGQVVEGEYSYYALTYQDAPNFTQLSDTNKYGCKVTVTVKDGKITKVVVADDTETFYNLSASWNGADGKPTAGKANWMAHGAEMAQSFVGMTVEAVKAIKVEYQKETVTYTPAGQPSAITDAPAGVALVVGGVGSIAEGAGATQSSGRLILAIQNALSKLK